MQLASDHPNSKNILTSHTSARFCGFATATCKQHVTHHNHMALIDNLFLFRSCNFFTAITFSFYEMHITIYDNNII